MWTGLSDPHSLYTPASPQLHQLPKCSKLPLAPKCVADNVKHPTLSSPPSRTAGKPVTPGPPGRIY